MDVDVSNENNNNNVCGKEDVDKTSKDTKCTNPNMSQQKTPSQPTQVETHSSVSDTNKSCFGEKTLDDMSAQMVHEILLPGEDKSKANNTNNNEKVSVPQVSGITSHRENKPLASIMSQENRQRTKKYSHPICMPFAASSTSPINSGNLNSPPINQYSMGPLTFSRNVMPSQTFAVGPTTVGASRSPVMRRVKKHSMPVVPILSLNDVDDGEEDDVTKRLETAVRRISRGSPNRQVYPGSSPLMGRTSPNRFGYSPQDESPVGLSGLARGYEQYREWLTTLRPTTEFGEASSDDLSSEWESSSEMELARIYGSVMSFSVASPTSTTSAIQSNAHPAVRRRRSAEERKKEMQKKGHYRRPADDAIDDDEEYDGKKDDCDACKRGNTAEVGANADGSLTKIEEGKQNLQHHKQHSIKRVG